MRRLVICLLICLLWSTNGIAAEFSFRDGIKWGMTKSRVKKIETAKLESHDPMGLYYELTSDNPEVADIWLVYEFDDKELYACKLFYTSIPGAANGFYNEYETLKANIVELYGEPMEFREKGKYFSEMPDDFDQNNKVEGLLKRYFVMYNVWETPDSIIRLQAYIDLAHRDILKIYQVYFNKELYIK